MTLGTATSQSSQSQTSSQTYAGFAGGIFDIVTPGNITIEPGTTITAGVVLPSGSADVILQAGGSFINNSGLSQAALLTTNNDFFNIYSAAPGGDMFGALNSANTAVWDTGFLTPVTAAGNRYIFAFQPILTVTAGNLTKQQGTDVTSSLAGDYTITGIQSGIAGVYLGDTASAVYSGTPSVASAGAAAGAAGGSYPITISQGGLLVNDGYELQLTSANLTVNGTTTVTPPPVATTTTTVTPPVTPILTTSATTVLTGFTTSIQPPVLSAINSTLRLPQLALISLPVVVPPPPPPGPPVDGPLADNNSEQPTSSDQTTSQVAGSLDGNNGSRGGGGVVIPRMLVAARLPTPPPTDISALSYFGNSSLWQ